MVSAAPLLMVSALQVKLPGVVLLEITASSEDVGAPLFHVLPFHVVLVIKEPLNGLQPAGGIVTVDASFVVQLLVVLTAVLVAVIAAAAVELYWPVQL
jgi:hypothetical protein